jgi:hypothetical protein
MAMSEALLVSDQEIHARFVAQSPYTGGNDVRPQSLAEDMLVPPGPSILSGNNTFCGEQTWQGYGLVHQQKGGLVSAVGSPASSDESTALDEYLCNAKAALEKVAKLGERAQKARNFQEEMKWLAENRHKFLGRWIALQGQKLLAEGSTAKEVFAKVADQKTPPLVVQIIEEELPFAGW